MSCEDTFDGTGKNGGEFSAEAQQGETSRRQGVRLSTVYGGRVCQFGKGYACVVSDISEGGAQVHLKSAEDFKRLTKNGTIQLIFERLSDYKALNATIAWVRPQERLVGLRFTDPPLRCRLVMKRLMPNRWRVAHEQVKREEAGD